MRTELKLASLDIRMWPLRHQMPQDSMEGWTARS